MGYYHGVHQHMSDLLNITGLHVSYDQGINALHGVDLRVAAGQRIGLIGPNGAGKTSLMMAILRAVPSTGRVVLDGIELSRRTVEQVRGRCGMVFQDADDQLFMPTLLDDVAFGPLNQDPDAETARRRAVKAIAAVGLGGLENRPAHHLSGGQKRCAALATVLAMQVKLLLLDEPGANLDFRSRRRLVEILLSRPEAMLLASHDLDMVGRLCQEVVLLDEGRIVAQGPSGEILANKALLEAHGLA